MRLETNVVVAVDVAAVVAVDVAAVDVAAAKHVSASKKLRPTADSKAAQKSDITKKQGVHPTR